MPRLIRALGLTQYMATYCTRSRLVAGSTVYHETFVAEWLKAHLPYPFQLKPQERIVIGPDKTVRFDIDLVLNDGETGKALFVLDTRYKKSLTPATEDIAQVVAYAEAKNCHDAILIYPSPLTESLDVWIGDNRVRSLSFSINGGLDEAGNKFIENLLLS
jgi:5-methylcytosine-specific restriction enzyme subunit McrC